MATITSPPATERSRGRGLLWAGLGIAVLAVALFFAQFMLLKRAFTPWYLPALTTVAALAVLVSVGRRGTVVRILMLLLIAGLAGLEWYFVAAIAKLPSYSGPAQAGKAFPAFETTLADGRSFTHKDLQDGTPSVMTFFRGRW
jgi:hypothetical protein